MANRIEAKSIGITTDRLLRDREDAKRHHVSLQQYYALSKRARELDMSLETLQEKKKAARAHRVSLEEYISDEEEAMELGVQGGSLAKLYAAREYAEAHGYDRTLSEGERAELGNRLRGRGAGGAGSGLYIDMPQAILDIEVAAKRGCPVEQIFEDRQLAQANGLHEEQVAADRKEADEQGIAVMQLYAERDGACAPTYKHVTLMLLQSLLAPAAFVSPSLSYTLIFASQPLFTSHSAADFFLSPSPPLSLPLLPSPPPLREQRPRCLT
jgi:hypothetical protein